MWKSSVEFTLVAALCVAFPCAKVHATGMYSPQVWLDQGGAAADQSPEFYWELEIKRMAIPFKPSEQRVVPKTKPAADANSQPEKESLGEQAAELDLADYQAALDKGLIKEADAMAQHKAARDAIAAANETTTAPLPQEPSSEFRDYNMGAFAFHLGQKHYGEAAQIWETLLKRPAEQRHYRSVWAAFMLGKLDVYAQHPEAVKWMQMARQLAKDGFADSPGLAADSYGWEAKSELDQGHLEKAAKLYLTQLALGDDSAIVSLKALVPDRVAIEGTLNFNATPPENADEATLKKFNDDQSASLAARLDRAVRDPLLRRLTTAHVLATETVGGWMYQDENSKVGQRCKRWLAAVEKARVSDVEDADQLGWVAYTAGNYAEAARWLKLGKGESATALWLKAKLLRRAGKAEEATKAMAGAWKQIKDTARKPVADPFQEGGFTMWSPGLEPLQSASGDLGALHLTRGDFVNAFDVLETGNMHDDAAFVAERVLTVDELKQYVDAHYPWNAEADAKAKDGGTSGTPVPGFSTRWMLGRRLVREDRYDEARAYLAAEQRPILDKYVAALTDGANEKLPKARRARAWFDAATIARVSGMELMGYEGAPDGFVSGGDFESTDIAGQRDTGTVMETKFEGDKEVTVPKPIKLVVPVSTAEKKRLADSKPAPNKRFHYRYVAAALGWKAALLLPDQSDELADVLNTAGGWIKKDDKAADKFIQAIERRASKTSLGKEASSKHWFVDKYGPWSVAPKE